MTAKITRVERFTLQVPFIDRVRREMERAGIHTWSELEITRIETDAGVVGWGEPNCEGALDVVAAAVRDMMPAVIGADVSRITLVWHKLYTQRFYSGGPILMSALAGIDQALWDIAGKTLGVPVHRLLGQVARPARRAAAQRQPGGHTCGEHAWRLSGGHQRTNANAHTPTHARQRTHQRIPVMHTRQRTR